MIFMLFMPKSRITLISKTTISNQPYYFHLLNF